MALGWFLLGLFLGTCAGIFLTALLQAAAKHAPSHHLAGMEPEFGMASSSAIAPAPRRGFAQPEVDRLCKEAGVLYGHGV